MAIAKPAASEAKPSVEFVFTQARRIIEKFGGERALQRALKDAGHDIDITRIYRWTYPRSRGGTGGLIPSQQIPHILKAARLQGVLIVAEDLYSAGAR